MVRFHRYLGLSVFLSPLLTKIPMPCLYGVFLYMGFSSLKGVQFFDRIKLLFIPKKHHPGKHIALSLFHRSLFLIENNLFSRLCIPETCTSYESSSVYFYSNLWFSCFVVHQGKYINCIQV